MTRNTRARAGRRDNTPTEEPPPKRQRRHPAKRGQQGNQNEGNTQYALIKMVTFHCRPLITGLLG